MDWYEVIVFNVWIYESASLFYTLPAYTVPWMSLRNFYLMHQ